MAVQTTDFGDGVFLRDNKHLTTFPGEAGGHVPPLPMAVGARDHDGAKFELSIESEVIEISKGHDRVTVMVRVTT